VSPSAAPLTRDKARALVEQVLPILATERHVAEFFHVHPRTVRRWRDEGRLDSLRTTPSGAGRVLYPRDAVVDLLVVLSAGTPSS